MKTWQEIVKDCYFESHLPINDIEALTGISRQSISAYLKKLPGFQEEKEKRKASNRVQRKEYKKEKNREYRDISRTVTAESMKQEHDVAVMILSHEKYY